MDVTDYIYLVSLQCLAKVVLKHILFAEKYERCESLIVISYLIHKFVELYDVTLIYVFAVLVVQAGELADRIR